VTWGVNWRGLSALYYKELLRFYKVATQTVLAPVITSLLYLLVFSHVLQEHVQVYPGVRYTTFLIPGLVMMTVIQNAFANSSSSLIQSKITGNLVFILLAPLSPLEFFLAFVLGATTRAVAVGLGVYLAALPFVDLPLAHPVLALMFMLAASVTLAGLGVVAGLWAEKFDQLAGFQNFIVVPLSFLSGVFYSIHSLPAFWLQLSHLNPFFYMIDGFRYAFFGISDVPPAFSFSVVLVALLALSTFTVALLARGYKIRN
jgi:ABC-2 type transport system permease protein